jgi:Flp pilus assembly pilin Flp
MNRLPTFSHPAVDFLVTFLKARVEHVRSDEDLSRGASAVEWVIISAVVVTIVGVVAFIINGALKGKATDVGNCIQGSSDTKTC